MEYTIGCDIVEIKRIKVSMQKEGFLKILTAKEKELFENLSGKRQAQWLAGRFAAKEAIYKATHNQFPCTLCEIEILSDEQGKPYCNYPSKRINISISHESDYAVAFAFYAKE